MTLTTTHLVALLPLILVCATAIVVMLGIAWRRHHTATTIVTSVGLNLALLSLLIVWQVTPIRTPLLIIDGLSVFAMVLILVSALACTTLAHAYLEYYRGPVEEFYLLLLCSVAGA
ncbi:hypothetical protein [Halomonas sp. PR-M31]|uniref:hypothetical protein n=1 Tax=Halomonas sp. PR-M31 TaxID=1471202 RepID=UPI000B1ED7B5|nr:hypothetical protein [Halomonas sp. PR-M31]